MDKFVFLFTLFICCTTVEDPINNPNVTEQTVLDVDDNEYGLTTIGSQVWFTSNLRTTKYSDGSPIIELVSNEEWDDADDNWTPARCMVNNDYSLKNTHGFFYNFWAVSPTYNGGKNICPDGYRIPSLDDWEELQLFLDPNGNLLNNEASGPLKLTGTAYWRDPNAGATNTTGFSALPSGDRSGSSGSFDDFDRDANFWTATSEEPESGGGRSYWANISFGNTELFIGAPKTKAMGYNCRCIR